MTAFDLLQDDSFPLYRPPSEGENLIIPVTVGCSHNRCAFCSMYRGQRFRIRPLDEVTALIQRAAAHWPGAHRVFLAAGDGLAIPTPLLLPILEALARHLPRLARVSCYASPANLLGKSSQELRALREARLSLIYVGIESGYDPLLRWIGKGTTGAEVEEGLGRAAAAGIKVSATVILGLGGREWWREHVDHTVELLHRVPVHYLSTLQLMLDPGLAAGFRARFDPPFRDRDDGGMLEEQRRLIAGLTRPVRPIVFRSNHSSNALPLAGNLPRDRDRLLAAIDAAREGLLPLRPAWRRGL